jgi:hypothetical protein
MTLSTASTINAKLFTLKDIEEAVLRLRDMPNHEWFLCDPEGRIWSGKPEELLQVLIPFHPLLKHPILGAIK